jgi:hypothetical protein
MFLLSLELGQCMFSLQMSLIMRRSTRPAGFEYLVRLMP